MVRKICHNLHDARMCSIKTLGLQSRRSWSRKSMFNLPWGNQRDERKRTKILSKLENLRKCWRVILGCYETGRNSDLFARNLRLILVNPKLPFSMLTVKCFDVSLRCLLSEKCVDSSLNGDHFHVSWKMTFISRNICVGSLPWENRKDAKTCIDGLELIQFHCSDGLRHNILKLYQSDLLFSIFIQ